MEKKKRPILSVNFVYRLINRAAIWQLESLPGFGGDWAHFQCLLQILEGCTSAGSRTQGTLLLFLQPWSLRLAQSFEGRRQTPRLQTASALALSTHLIWNCNIIPLPLWSTTQLLKILRKLFRLLGKNHSLCVALSSFLILVLLGFSCFVSFPGSIKSCTQVCIIADSPTVALLSAAEKTAVSDTFQVCFLDKNKWESAQCRGTVPFPDFNWISTKLTGKERIWGCTFLGSLRDFNKMWLYKSISKCFAFGRPLHHQTWRDKAAAAGKFSVNSSHL